MLKKILTTLIWMVILVGIVYAFDDMPGIVVTLIDQDEIEIPGQMVIIEMRLGGQISWDYGVTDEDGEVNFGSAGDEGIYIMTTEYNSKIYNTTVAKNPGQRLFTWQLGLYNNPE